MLDPVDPAEVALAVGTDGGIRAAVLRSAGVVVRDHRGVEVEDIHRAVGSQIHRNWAEPVVSGPQPLTVLENQFPMIAVTAWGEPLVVDDIKDRLGHEDR